MSKANLIKIGIVDDHRLFRKGLISLIEMIGSNYSILFEADNGLELQQKIDKGANEFVIDLAPLNLMNSIGLNFLLSLFSKTKKTGGSLILANASQQIQKILEITKLSNVFNIQPTVKHAVDSFSMDLVPSLT